MLRKTENPKLATEKCLILKTCLPQKWYQYFFNYDQRFMELLKLRLKDTILTQENLILRNKNKFNMRLPA